VHRKPKPAEEKAPGRKEPQPVPSTSLSSAAVHAQTSRAADNRQRQHWASSPTRQIPVTVARHGIQVLPPGDAEYDSDRRRPDKSGGQNEVKGQGHPDNRRHKSGSSGDQGNRKDDRDADHDAVDDSGNADGVWCCFPNHIWF